MFKKQKNILRKVFLLMFFIFSSLFTYSQLGLYSKDSLLWIQSVFGGIGSPHHGSYTSNSYTEYNFINGDTIIGNKKLKKLYSYNTGNPKPITFYNLPPYDYSWLSLDSYIYEDSNIVYRSFKNKPDEFFKVLDFNIIPGDSFRFLGYDKKLKLISIDKCDIDGNTYDRYNFEKGIKWVKGIGDIAYGGTFGSYYFLDYEYVSSLKCYSERNKPIYGKYCFNTSVFESCKLNENTIIYPIPANNRLYVLTCSKNINYLIYSISGCKVLEGTTNSYNNQIDISSIANGLYLIKLSDPQNNNLTISRLFVKRAF